MLYDEYPDALMIRKLAKDILESLRKQTNHTSESLQTEGVLSVENQTDELKELLSRNEMDDYIVILLINEMIKRRHKSGKHYYLY